MNKITMTEIARMLGVSQTTVSFVLNGKAMDRISPETADKILSAAKRYNYHPNQAARQLRKGKSNLILVAAPAPNTTFLGSFIVEIQRLILSAGYNSSYFFWGKEENPIARLVKHVGSFLPEGIIALGPGELPDNLAPFTEIYDTGADARYCNFDVVFQNVAAGMTELRDYLLRGKVKSLCYVGIKSDVRYSTIQQLFSQCGIALETYSLPHSAVDIEDGRKIFAKIWRRKKRPRILVGFNDNVAAALMSAALEKGVSIPGELGIVGYDDQNFTQLLRPQLATIGGCSAEVLACTIFSQLQIRMRNPQAPRMERILDTKFILRDSCRLG